MTVLKTLSVLRTTNSKIPCAVQRNTLSPTAVISMGGSVLVDLSILDSTTRIDAELMKRFDGPEATKSRKPAAS